MIKFIDDFLNGITQYRLTLYFLVFLLAVAVILSAFGVLPFNPIALLFSAAFLTVACWVTNKVFARIFRAPTNLESVYITSLILVLIVTPARSLQDIFFLAAAAVLSQSSKYLLAINKKHIFNPAAFGVAFLMVLRGGASWWVGNPWMMPAVVLGGLLVARKLKRFNMIASFLTVFLAANFGSSLQITIFESPTLFFAFIMLTEPLTTPPNKKLQIIYGSLVGVLFAPFVHVGSFYLTPETALLIGNIFSYMVSPKGKLLLKLKKKILVASDIYDFVFNLDKKFVFLPGQYLEWTLAHPNPDSRGVRRYFTIAASPTEGNLRIGIKFYPSSSSFKKSLASLNPGSKIIASQLLGEFILPKDLNNKLCFIAGGIGITPFRSMVKYLLDTNQKRDIVLLYSNKTALDIAYGKLFDQARSDLDLKTVYILTDSANVPKGWKGRVGYIDSGVIKEEVPDYKDRIFYISGPHTMVDAFESTLKGMGLGSKQIKVDFFPGYA